MDPELDEQTARVLAALVDGYRAREGMKPRARALSEYELARRLGITQYSYAEFEKSAERAELLRALDILTQRRLIVRAQPSGRYDTFHPADAAETRPAHPTLLAASAPPQDALLAALERLSNQLDTVIAHLRSIDRKLGPD